MVVKKTYFWIEDRKGKASYTFWKCLLKTLFPNIILESKNNSSELIKAVRRLEDEQNRYIIVLDNSFDNVQSILEFKQLKEFSSHRTNIRLMDIICFEYVLLGFKDLISWIYAPDDEFLTRRSKAISARDKLVRSIDAGMIDYKRIQEIADYDKHLNEHNIEQLVARLLFELTRNTGFEVSKGKIGECWVNSCCEWQDRQENDICGLDHRKMSLLEKMRSVYMGSCLKEQLASVGLEVTL